MLKIVLLIIIIIVILIIITIKIIQFENNLMQKIDSIQEKLDRLSPSSIRSLESVSSPLKNSLTAKYLSCPVDSSGQKMLCGYLTIGSGLGNGNYGTGEPGVHGLWPNVDFGESPCINPVNMKYNSKGTCKYLNKKTLAEHEWEKHGICAGGPGPSSYYFNLACSLGKPIVYILNDTLKTGVDSRKNRDTIWSDMKTEISRSVYRNNLHKINETTREFMFKVKSEDKGNTWVLY